MAALQASLATLRSEASRRGSSPPHTDCTSLRIAGQPPGYFGAARAYHDPLPDAFCGCDGCADMSDELRDGYEAAELIRLKSRQGHAPLPDCCWTEPWVEGRDDTDSDSSNGYCGDDVGDYLGVEDEDWGDY